MRKSLWLVTLACLLVAAQAIQLPNIEEPDEDEDVLDELAPEDDLDMEILLKSLFDETEVDEEDDDDEEVTGRELVEPTVSEQERYNTFMDTLLSQLKRQVKRDLEPLKFTLTKPKKNAKNGKKKQRKNKNKKNKKDDKDEKKNKRKSKEVVLPVFTDVVDDVHQIQKRQAETEELTDRLVIEDEDNEKEKRNKKWRKNNRNNNKKNKNNKKQRKSNNKVVLHGLSHIAREGDVKRYNMKKGTALLTEFVIGPIELDVTRKIDSEEHKAAATAEELKGKIMIKINEGKKPRVKKLVIGKAKDITTTGSLARSFGNSGVGIVKRMIKQAAPTAIRSFFKATKAIIQDV